MSSREYVDNRVVYNCSQVLATEIFIMSISHIHHVSVIVADTQTALEFYCGVLGLRALDRRSNLTFPGAWLEVGEQQIHLLELPDPYSAAESPKYGGRDRHMALNTDDFEEIRARLDAANIPYQLSSSGRDALFCRDHDGNAIEIVG